MRKISSDFLPQNHRTAQVGWDREGLSGPTSMNKFYEEPFTKKFRVNPLIYGSYKQMPDPSS